MQRRTITGTVVVSILITLFVTSTAFAQLGVRGGVNLANFIGSDSGDAEDVMGLNVGFSLTLVKIGPFSITPEIYYAQKGARYSDQIAELMQAGEGNGEFDEELLDLEFRLDYLEVPVLAKISFPLGERNYLKPYIAGGPVFAWRLGCEISLTSQTEHSVQECTNDFSDVRTAFHNADRGYAVGTGVDLEVPVLGIFTIDARMVRGLSRIRDDGENDDIHNRSFSLMLGYTLNL